MIVHSNLLSSVYIYSYTLWNDIDAHTCDVSINCNLRRWSVKYKQSKQLARSRAFVFYLSLFWWIFSILILTMFLYYFLFLCFLSTIGNLQKNMYYKVRIACSREVKLFGLDGFLSIPIYLNACHEWKASAIQVSCIFYMSSWLISLILNN